MGGNGEEDSDQKFDSIFSKFETMKVAVEKVSA